MEGEINDYYRVTLLQSYMELVSTPYPNKNEVDLIQEILLKLEAHGN